MFLTVVEGGGGHIKTPHKRARLSRDLLAIWPCAKPPRCHHYESLRKWLQRMSSVVVVYHAGLAQSILHHQHVRQAERRAGLQLLQGDFQGGGRHPGQRLEGRGGAKYQINSWPKQTRKCVTMDQDGHECLIGAARW